jgi:hypothetical protein
VVGPQQPQHALVVGLPSLPAYQNTDAVAETDDANLLESIEKVQIQFCQHGLSAKSGGSFLEMILNLSRSAACAASRLQESSL